jgi:DNA ligase (NAD+)
VARATLHNAEFLRQLDLHEGDTVVLRKAGGVIPEITEVLLNARVPGAAPVTYPHACPVCGETLTQEAGAAATYCPNEACAARVPALLEYVAASDVLDINGLGEGIIRALVEAGLAKDAASLFELTPAHLPQLAALKLTGEDGATRLYGAKNAAKLLAELEDRRSAEFWRFIRALGLRHTGKGTSTRVARVFPDFPRLFAASRAELEAIDDVGPATADAIFSGLQPGTWRRDVAERLLGAGITPEAPRNEKTGNGLDGLTLVLTGTFSRPRSEIEGWIAQNGGRVGSGVNKKTSFLVAGVGGGSKAQKAAALGTAVLSEDGLKTLMAERGVGWLN